MEYILLFIFIILSLVATFKFADYMSTDFLDKEKQWQIMGEVEPDSYNMVRIHSFCKSRLSVCKNKKTGELKYCCSKCKVIDN